MFKYIIKALYKNRIDILDFEIIENETQRPALRP